MVSLSFVYRTLVNKGLHNHTKEITMKTEKANNEKKNPNSGSNSAENK